MNLSAISLRYKLFGLALMLVVGTGVLLGVLAEWSGRRSLESLIGHQLAREAGYAAERLAEALRVELATLEDMARQPVMREVAILDLDKNVARALSALRAGSALRSGYVLLDAKGGVVAWDDVRGRPMAVEGPLGAVGGTRVLGLRTEEDGSRRLVVAVAVPDPIGAPAPVGVLFGALDWYELTRSLDALRRNLAGQGLSASVFVVDDAGRVLRESRAPEQGRDGDRPVERWLAGGAEDATSIDADWLVGRAPLPTPFSDWSLLVVEPRAEALAPVALLRERLVVLTALAVALGLLLAAASAERVVGPLRELTRAIENLARTGASSARRVPVRSRDEVGALATAFNDMSGDLERTQRELVDAEKFAFVGRVAAGVAHRVRTSLGVLRTSAQLLDRAQSPDASPQSREMLGLIGAEVDRLSGVVDDLLRLDHGHAVSPQTGDLREPLRAAVAFSKPRAVERRIQVRVDLPDEPVRARFDADAIEQVGTNLLANALDAVEAGGWIALRLEVDATSRWAMLFGDGGPGVDPEVRASIFEPFVTGRRDGIGLGLTLVRRIVDAHRWTIELLPDAGRGTWFRITGPVVEAEA